MIKVKSSQKTFTDTEIATLTGIGLERLCRLARTRHIGFAGRATAAGHSADQWLFTFSDLVVLATLYQGEAGISRRGDFPIRAHGLTERAFPQAQGPPVWEELTEKH